MKCANIFIFFVILITISGCDVYHPPKPLFALWSKRGADEIEVRKALLECGNPEPFGYRTDESNKVVRAAANFCMEQNGFRSDVPAKRFCRTYKDKNYEICRPGAVIPQRSVARRLNSDYCIRFKNNDMPECLP